MLKRVFIIALLGWFYIPTQVVAEDITLPIFTCTPDNFVLLPIKNGYRLMGSLETPTPNYTYKMRAPTSVRTDLLQVPIDLIAPKGMTTMVIGELAIDHIIQTDQNLMRFTASLYKGFDWGPETIHCARYINDETTKPEPMPTEEIKDTSDTKPVTPKTETKTTPLDDALSDEPQAAPTPEVIEEDINTPKAEEVLSPADIPDVQIEYKPATIDNPVEESIYIIP